MSWWGNWDKGISKMASTALKQAQKKIDKVLDIQEGEVQSSEISEPNLESPVMSIPGNDSFFHEWLGSQEEPFGSKRSTDRIKSVSTVDIKESSSENSRLRTSSKMTPNRDSADDFFDEKLTPSSKPDKVFSQAKELQNISDIVQSRPASLKMSDSQITNVGDWSMSESTMLISQFDDILNNTNDSNHVSSTTTEVINPTQEVKFYSPSVIEPTAELCTSTRSDYSSAPEMKTSKADQEVDKYTNKSNIKPNDRTNNEDEDAMLSSIADRASHLSLSSDCTDLTLRGDEFNTGSRGISPSDQLTLSKDSNDSVYSSKSLHSEPLLESPESNENTDFPINQRLDQEIETSEEMVDVTSNTRELPNEDHIASSGKLDEGTKDSKEATSETITNVPPNEVPLEIAMVDQPAFTASIPPSPIQPESSPTGLVLDECETGTSSDIEVISSSCTSNNGGDLHLPGTSFDPHHIRLSSHTRSVSDCSFLSNIMESTPSDENLSQSALSKKLSETKEVLEIRESKLLQMSKENVDLRETNNILRQQLHQSECARQEEMTDINALTVEFTNRIGEAEKRLQNAAREKEQLKKKIQKMESEMSNKSEERRFERLLVEKQEQIDELLQEGEKMAQEQLKTNNIVKKLRIKERETDAALQAQTARADKLESENEHLKNVLDNRDENEKQHVDAINQLTRAVQKQDKEILQYKRQVEESQEKARSLQTNLEAVYKELSELHKSNAAAASEAANATLSAEVAAREHTKAAVAQMEASWTDERRLLRTELEELRFSLSSSERESARREEQLRGEIEYLHGRLSTAEQRNEELTSGLGNATKPVLRQLEALQCTFSAQSSSWEQTERQLNERLVESQKALSTASEQERDWRERVAELEGRLSAQESQVTTLRQEKGRQAAALQTEKSRAELLEEEKHRLLTQLNTGQLEWKTEREDLRKDLLLAENTLELTRSQLDVEKRRSLQLSDRIIAAERRATLAAEQQQKERHTSTSSQNSGDSTPRSYRHSNSTSLYSLLRDNNASGGAALLEHLQASVQQKDGDIAQLHRDVQHLDKTREALILDMMVANQKTEELEEKLSHLQEQVTDHESLKQRYNALLQMFGEKMEENEELRLDLQDVKEMYKAQIDILTQVR